MPSLNRYEKVTCDNCATQTTKLNLARHMNSCSAGTLHCTQCTNLFTKSQNDLNYLTAKRHSAPKPDVTLKCKLCYQEFPGFYALRQKKHSTRHADRIRNKRSGCGFYKGRCWRSQVERRVKFLSTFHGGFGTWNCETKSIQLRSEISQRNNRERKTWPFFQQFEIGSKSESGFLFHS